MRQVFAIVIMLVMISPAEASAGDPATARVTSKAADSFNQCFVAAQEHASQPWSFVPRESGGGTFTNRGAHGVRHPYLLDVADRGATREIRLTLTTPDRSVLEAVDRCV